MKEGWSKVRTGKEVLGRDKRRVKNSRIVKEEELGVGEREREKEVFWGKKYKLERG